MHRLVVRLWDVLLLQPKLRPHPDRDPKAKNQLGFGGYPEMKRLRLMLMLFSFQL